MCADQAVVLRAYCPEHDAATTLAVFRRAVLTTARAAYDQEQCEAWNGAVPSDLDDWNARLTADPAPTPGSGSCLASLVAELPGAVTRGPAEVVGFATLLANGCVDMLFVDPDSARQGIAGRMLAALIERARAERLTKLQACGSRLAVPVFERAGFTFIESRQGNRVGRVTVPNALLELELALSPGMQRA